MKKPKPKKITKRQRLAAEREQARIDSEILRADMMRPGVMQYFKKENDE